MLLIDLLGLSALEFKSPKVYDCISKERYFLTSLDRTSFKYRIEENKDTDPLSEHLKSYMLNEYELKAIKSLFGFDTSVWDPKAYNKLNHRISSRLFVDNYFLIAPSALDISEETVQRICQSDLNELKEYLNTISYDSELVKKFFEMIYSFATSLNTEQLTNLEKIVTFDPACFDEGAFYTNYSARIEKQIEILELYSKSIAKTIFEILMKSLAEYPFENSVHLMIIVQDYSDKLSRGFGSNIPISKEEISTLNKYFEEVVNKNESELINNFSIFERVLQYYAHISEEAAVQLINKLLNDKNKIEHFFEWAYENSSSLHYFYLYLNDEHRKLVPEYVVNAINSPYA